MMLFRKILFYCFLLFYLTACPLLIFYTLGYRFDLKGDEGIVKTGALSITTYPEAASVKLDGRKVLQKTPGVILNLRLGHYDLRVEKEGYQTWTNQIRIEAERAVVIDKIILLPAELKPELAAQGRFTQIELFKEGTHMLGLRGPRLSELLVLDLIKSTPMRFSDETLKPFQEAKVTAVYTVPASAVFWLWLDDVPGNRMMRVRLRAGGLEAEDWSRFFPKKPDSLQWEPSSENRVYAFRDGDLTAVDLDRETAALAGSRLQGFKLYKQRLFMSSQSGVVRADSDGKHPRALLDDPVLGAALFEEREHLHIGVYPGGNLLFLDPKGTLFCNRLPYWIARKNIRGYVYDEMSFQAAIWTANKIGVLDFSRDSFLREEAFERKIKKRWIYREGRSISQVRWVADGTQLVFMDENKVYLLETMRGLEARPRFLVEADPALPMFFSEHQGVLYYGDLKTGSWMSVRLIPKRDILGEAFVKTGLIDERTNPRPAGRPS